MSPEALNRLADFESRHKPDTATVLVVFREEILHLYFKGYGLGLIFKYLQECGVGCSRRTFERWVKANINFEAEQPPESAKRAPVVDREGETTGGQGAQQVFQRPLASPAGADFSLAGANPDDPRLRPGEGGAASKLPKLPVLVAEETPSTVQSPQESGTEADQQRREARLKEARERRESNFKNPVEKALERKR